MPVSSMLQIEKAEAALMELKQVLNKEDQSTVKRLSDEFYSHLPHKLTHQHPIDSKATIARKQDVCQVCLSYLRSPVI